jgi:hypothetical protein
MFLFETLNQKPQEAQFGVEITVFASSGRENWRGA